MTDQRKGGPAPRISRETIEEAVIAVGFDRATTTTIARHLGVDQSSLYRHISSRHELMTGAIDRVLRLYEWRTPAPDGAEFLRRLGDTMYRMLSEHPGLAAQLYALEGVPSGSAKIMVDGVAVLEGYGWSVEDAVLVLDSISDMTGDCINQIEAAERQERIGIDAVADIFSTASTENPGLGEQVGAYIVGTLRSAPRNWWERKLELLISGAEALREAKATLEP